jgi:hypothetical protein
MSALDPRMADRLTKLLGMLGSEHDGERAAAAAKAHKLISGLGMTWPDIIAPRSPAPTSTDDLIREALTDGEGVLTAWEEGFLRGIRGRQYLTQKQLAKLDRITVKVRAYREAAS